MEERLCEKFATLDEILKDNKFKDLLGEILVKFENRPAPKPGFHYKRGIYEYLKEGRYLTVDRFIALFIVINAHAGPKHPMAVRDFVKDTVVDVCVATIKYYKSLEESERNAVIIEEAKKEGITNPRLPYSKHSS